MKGENKTILIGEVYYIDFGVHENNEQGGWRPGVIFQNNTGNRYSPNVIALPLTTALKRQDMPTHVVLPAQKTGLPKDSMVLCENPVCVSKALVGDRVTTLSAEYMEQIAIAHLYATAAIAFIDPSALMYIQKKATQLNAAGGNK